MTDLRAQLQSSLGDSYKIERELGGGGMSRVFVATERALGRTVVVKILPSEAAAQVSLERFKREILLAARLQHPHIVPLLSAGDAGGLPYFTMPYVEGESLRARLARHGELPISDAVRVLREIATALSYAHDRGIVHRDIKPDNVLLSGGSAMVTDFGVAKALSASSNAEHGGFTSLGVALGTPAYMAPEQATADPAIDHRADVYAFGVLAYELLTGQPPFIGRTPQNLLAAHVAEAPEHVGKRRSLPPALSAMVMRCLEKRPADRLQSAADVVHALDDITTPSGGTQPTSAVPSLAKPVERESRKARWLVVGTAAIALAASGVFVLTNRANAGGRIDTIGVLPIEDISGRDSVFVAAMHDAVTNALTRARNVGVAPRSAMMRYRGSQQAIRDIARENELDAVVEATVFRAGDVMRINVQFTDPVSRRALWSDTYERNVSNVLAAQNEVAEKIAAGVDSALRVPPP
jgi:serine/threonine-protein kinase